MSIFSFFDTKKQLEALKARVDEVAHDMAQAKLDYDELYERVRRILAKLARRDQAEAESSSQEGTHTEEGNGQTRALTVPSTDRRRALINAQLEARRKGLPMPKGGE